MSYLAESVFNTLKSSGWCCLEEDHAQDFGQGSTEIEHDHRLCDRHHFVEAVQVRERSDEEHARHTAQGRQCELVSGQGEQF